MSNYDKKIFARNLQRLMDEAGKSRKDMCAALDFNYYTFTDWIKGRKIPHIDKIEIIAEYFGVQKSDLIEDKRLKEQPEEMAIFAASILKDPELLDVIKKYQKLSQKNKNAVIQMIENLSE